MRLAAFAPTLLVPALLVPALLGLVACDRETVPPAPPAPTPEPSHVLGGVDLDQPVKALGNEPFWYVTMDGKTMTYGGPDRPERRAPQSGPQMQGTTATFTGETAAGQSLEVTLIATECSDGMSDRTYPLVARVKVADETLTGCAAANASFTTEPE